MLKYSVSLSVPAAVASGGVVNATGTVSRAPRGVQVELQRLEQGRWITLGRAPVKHGRFRAAFNAPTSTVAVLLNLRVVVLKGKRRLAVSTKRSVRLRPSAAHSGVAASRAAVAPESPATTTPVGSAAPTGPPTPGEILVTASAVSVAAGSVVDVTAPAPLASVTSVESTPAGATLGVSVSVVGGQVAVAASALTNLGTMTLSVTGNGCVASECERRLEMKVPVTVTAIKAPEGPLESFTTPSPDRVASATNHDLPDELLLTMGTPEDPGTRLQAAAAATAAGGVVSGGLEEAGIYQIRWSSSQNLAEKRSTLETQPGVKAVSFSTVGLGGDASSYPVATEFDLGEWTWPYEQVEAQRAWSMSTGSNIKVGIIDEGDAYAAHEDLHVIETVGPGQPRFHATHVAGLACAKNNAPGPQLGMVGIGWGCPIVTTAVEYAGNSNTAILRAMKEFASHAGIDVVNLSMANWNGCATVAQAKDMASIDADEQPMFEQVLAGVGKHIVWTIAAGNTCMPGVASPYADNSQLANVITVAATNSDGNLASFSNYGPGVDVAAPGGVSITPASNGLMSTALDGECPPADACPAFCFYAISYCGTYKEDSGTSMAAPIVAGIAALVLGENTHLTAEEAGHCITSTAGTGAAKAVLVRDTKPAMKVVPAFPYTGSLPIVNAAAAVECAAASTLPPPPGLPGSDGTIVGQGPTTGVLWRLAVGPHGSERGQPELAINETAYSTLDPTVAECLAHRYVLRDFVKLSAANPLIWDQESEFPAQCPSSAPELHLPTDATHWILREASGRAWYLDGREQLEPIATGAEYIECAQYYLVLDDVTPNEVTAFPSSGDAHASCGPLRITTAEVPGISTGKDYEHALSAAGGDPPYTWSLATGTLPEGISLTAGGVIKGTTTQTGVFHLTVRVRDGEDTEATKSVELTAFPASDDRPWETVDSFAPALAANPSLSCPDTEHCWAIQDGQLVATGDGGKTWTSQQLELPAATVGEAGASEGGRVTCGDDSHCLLAPAHTSGGGAPALFATSNGGESWSTTAAPTEISIGGEINCYEASSCHAIGTRTDGEPVLLSTDNLATNWRATAMPSAVSPGSLTCRASNVCAITGTRDEKNVVALTSNSGASWTVSEVTQDATPVAVSCGSPTTCVLTTEKDGEPHDPIIEYTSDGGLSWQTGELPAGAEYVIWASCADASHCWAIGKDTTGTVFETTNGGASWSEREGLEGDAPLHTGISCPSAATCFVNGTAEGDGTLDFSMVMTHDAGSLWESQEIPQLGPARAIGCANVEDCVVGSFGGTADLQTTDGGQTWQVTGQIDYPLLSLGEFCFVCLGQHRLEHVSCAPNGPCWGVFLFGIDGSLGVAELVDGSWVSKLLPEDSLPLNLSCVSAKTCFVSTNKGLYVTHDEGETWTNTDATNVERSGGAVSCSNEDDCVVAAETATSGELLVTGDGGETWQAATSGPTRDVQLDCTASEVCWASSPGEAIWRSEDGGYTWERESLSGFGAISCSDGEECSAVDSSGEVRSTHDGGKTWADAGTVGVSFAGESLACVSTTVCFSAAGDSVYKMPGP